MFIQHNGQEETCQGGKVNAGNKTRARIGQFCQPILARVSLFLHNSCVT
jgi:hypothetical protein